MNLTWSLSLRLLRGAGVADAQPEPEATPTPVRAGYIRELDKKHLKYLKYHKADRKPKDRDHWPFKR